MRKLTIEIPEEADLNEAKMLLAAVLFDKGFYSSGQAAKFVGISRRDFLENVGKFGVSIFGETVEDLEKDL